LNARTSFDQFTFSSLCTTSTARVESTVARQYGPTAARKLNKSTNEPHRLRLYKRRRNVSTPTAAAAAVSYRPRPANLTSTRARFPADLLAWRNAGQGQGERVKDADVRSPVTVAGIAILFFFCTIAVTVALGVFCRKRNSAPGLTDTLSGGAQLLLLAENYPMCCSRSVQCIRLVSWPSVVRGV